MYLHMTATLCRLWPAFAAPPAEDSMDAKHGVTVLLVLMPASLGLNGRIITSSIADSTGAYTVPVLQPSACDVTAVEAGFQTYRAPGVHRAENARDDRAATWHRAACLGDRTIYLPRARSARVNSRKRQRSAVSIPSPRSLRTEIGVPVGLILL